MPSVLHTSIAVTGGAGFLGSHLCEALLKQGHKVICVDNFYTGSHANIAHLRDYPDFKVMTHDVIEPYQLEVDEIYNLACAASPVHYQRQPVHTTRTCIMGAINALELAKKRGIKVLQSSTSEVYGNPEMHPQTENYAGQVNCTGPRACYNEGKRCAETLFFDYYRESGGILPIKVARIFNTYGPHMAIDDGRAISNFIVHALTGKDITIYGDGTQTRSFCYYTDMIDACIRLMNSDPSLTGPINLGNPAEITINELAQQIIALTGSRSRLVYKAPTADDPVRRRPDITQARTQLQWQPSTLLDDGLKATIAYFDDMLRADSGLRQQAVGYSG